jgi:hypothetical protein
MSRETVSWVLRLARSIARHSAASPRRPRSSPRANSCDTPRRDDARTRRRARARLARDVERVRRGEGRARWRARSR